MHLSTKKLRSSKFKKGYLIGRKLSLLTTKLVLIKKRHLDIPIAYVLLLYIPLPVIPIPNIPSRKSYLWNMYGVFMLGIPIPDLYNIYK